MAVLNIELPPSTLSKSMRRTPDMGAPSKGSSKGERAGFLNASRSAAICETIKKEERWFGVQSRQGMLSAERSPSCRSLCCRALHSLFQKQIELGRIVLPQEEVEGVGSALDDACPPADPAAIDRKLAWLLEAHRRAGQPLPLPLPLNHQAQENTAELSPSRQDAQPPATTSTGGATADSKAREQEEAEVREQLRGISRSLWSTLSATATGAGSYSSASRTQFQYRPEAVEAMQAVGELTAQHRRRRDEHSAHVEAMPRDAHLHRSSSKKPSGSC